MSSVLQLYDGKLFIIYNNWEEIYNSSLNLCNTVVYEQETDCNVLNVFIGYRYCSYIIDNDNSVFIEDETCDSYESLLYCEYLQIFIEKIIIGIKSFDELAYNSLINKINNTYPVFIKYCDDLRDQINEE